MRIATKVVFQMVEDGLELIEKNEFDYFGPIEECKGDSYAKQVSYEQLALEKAQIARQNAEFDNVKANLNKYLTGNIGFDPAQKAMLQSQFLNANSQDYNDAGSAVRDMLTARGGDGATPIGGNYVKGISGLMGSQASAKSGGLLNLGIMDAQQALNNKFNTASVLSGNAAALNSSIGTTGQVGASALSDYIKSKSQGFGASFMNSLGSGIGKGFADIATGGLSGMLSGKGFKSGVANA